MQCEIELDFCRKGRIGCVTGVAKTATFYAGLASRIAGLGVVGAPIAARPVNPRSPLQ